MKYTCKRCGHTWLTRLENSKPVCCPHKKCHSPYWDKERKVVDLRGPKGEVRL